MMKKIKQHPFFIKLLHWEYWSFNTVYALIYPYWIWLMIKARSAFFFNAANPLIKNGGFLMESKKEIYDLIPSAYYPATLFFKADTCAEKVLQKVREASLKYPLIAKPDIGMRGMLVQKIDTANELRSYIQQISVNFLVQEFVPYENEIGIFYCRYPGQQKGFISGIVEKEFLTVTGDGINNIEALLQRDNRYILQLPVLRETHSAILEKVLNNGEEHVLVPYGNHCRGSKFLDSTAMADEALVNTVDTICKEIPQFYFGRMDIRFNSWGELRQGKNFSIIELNGAGSEPTHMYDPKHSIFFAWKEIIRHWNILYKISKLNHSQQNIPYMKVKDGLRMLKENKQYVKKLAVRIKQQPLSDKDYHTINSTQAPVTVIDSTGY